MNKYEKQKAEIAKLKEKITQFEEKEFLNPMIKEFCSNLGICLSQLPYDSWPDFAKESLKYAAQRYSVPVQIYKNLLPK